jgi:hypothetical protein
MPINTEIDIDCEDGQVFVCQVIEVDENGLAHEKRFEYTCEETVQSEYLKGIIGLTGDSPTVVGGKTIIGSLRLDPRKQGYEKVYFDGMVRMKEFTAEYVKCAKLVSDEDVNAQRQKVPDGNVVVARRAAITKLMYEKYDKDVATGGAGARPWWNQPYESYERVQELFKIHNLLARLFMVEAVEVMITSHVLPALFKKVVDNAAAVEDGKVLPVGAVTVRELLPPDLPADERYFEPEELVHWKNEYDFEWFAAEGNVLAPGT